MFDRLALCSDVIRMVYLFPQPSWVDRGGQMGLQASYRPNRLVADHEKGCKKEDTQWERE